jgi:RHS repeat-associated protein
MLEKGPTPTGRTIMSNMGIDPDSFIGGIREGLQEIKQQEQTPVEIHFYHCDHLGTPIALTDRNGKIVWAARYDPWGNIEEEFNPHNIEQNIRLPGQHHDRETGLYYNRHRYYDPKIGAYINQDPIGLMGGANFYRYPTNPMTFIDSKGLAKCYIPSDEVISGITPTQGDNVAETALDAASTAVGSSASAFNAAGSSAAALAVGSRTIAGRTKCIDEWVEKAADTGVAPSEKDAELPQRPGSDATPLTDAHEKWNRCVFDQANNKGKPIDEARKECGPNPRKK